MILSRRRIIREQQAKAEAAKKAEAEAQAAQEAAKKAQSKPKKPKGE